MLVDRERVQERLQGRSRLAWRADCVEIRSIREITGAPDIRPNFAGRILDDDYRAIVNPSIANIYDLATQRVDDELLEFAIERASRRPALTVQQTLREMRRECDSRVVAAAGECAFKRRSNIDPRRAIRSERAAQGVRTNRDRFASRVGCPDQNCQHYGLGRIDSMRRFAEHHARRRPNSLQLTTVGDKVEVCFEDFRFRPSSFDLECSEDLPEFPKDRFARL